MTTLPEKGEGIFGYKIMDRTTVSMLGAQITEFSHIYSGARVLYIENDDRELGFNLIYRTPQLDQSVIKDNGRISVLYGRTRCLKGRLFFPAGGTAL